MNVLIVVLSTIVAINALLLIGLILIQQSKGGGFASSAFGGVGDAVFGAQTATHLTRLTIILTASFFILTLTLAIITGHRGDKQSVVEQQVQTDLETPQTAKEDEAKEATATATATAPAEKVKEVTAEVNSENEINTESEKAKEKADGSENSLQPAPKSKPVPVEK